MGNILDSVKEKVNIDYTLDETGTGIMLNMMIDGLSSMLEAKTVIGEPVEAGGALIFPIMEVTAGMAAGAFNKESNKKGAGGISTKISPIALLIIQDGKTRLLNLKDQDTLIRALDMAPELLDRISKTGVAQEVINTAKKMFKNHEFEPAENGYQTVEPSEND